MNPHVVRLIERIRRLPVAPPPAPWRCAAMYSVGSLTAVGYEEGGDRLLVVSSRGKGLFDCTTGQRVAREREPLPEPAGDGHEAACPLRCRGIGPLADRTLRLAGLHGGGLPTTTADGW